LSFIKTDLKKTRKSLSKGTDLLLIRTRNSFFEYVKVLVYKRFDYLLLTKDKKNGIVVKKNEYNEINKNYCVNFALNF